MLALKKYLDQLICLNKRDWEAFSQLFSASILKKGDYFARVGKVEKQMGFLTNGVIRAFFRNREGIEYNKTFFTENEFFGPYASLVTRQPNQINIQALTDCQILVADYQSVTKLYGEHRQIESMARLVAEHYFVIKEKREIELVLLQADERYKIFLQEYPNLENLIPQYHIASYLGITPTQLSRIRAKKS
jgi:CRP-like cAMP-binding protein